jgi:Uma2 family endonuclease
MIGVLVHVEERTMSSAADKTVYTPEEYLTFERKSPIKHEYCDGFILEVPRSNRWHNLITGNLSCEVGTQLRYRSCEVYAINMRVLVRPTRLYR